MRQFIALLCTILCLHGCQSDPEVLSLSHPNNFKAGILALHNEARSQVGVKPLRWSNALAKDAASWAYKLQQDHNCQMIHTQDTSQGENLALSIGAMMPPEQAVGFWYDERHDYQYHSNRCRPGKPCGHYTQMVWQQTQRVGCAIAHCLEHEPDGQRRIKEVWVCRYYPAGNTIGQKPY